MINQKEKAIKLICEAYSILNEAGIPEEFATLLRLVEQSNRGTFFGSFGSDSGCFIEFQDCDNIFTPVRMVFGVRRYKQSFFSRIKNAFLEAWAIFRGYDTEHEIYLNPNDITRLKDLLRVLR